MIYLYNLRNKRSWLNTSNKLSIESNHLSKEFLLLTIVGLLYELLFSSIKNKVHTSILSKGDDYAKYISLLTKKAKSMIRDLDPTNDLTFLRIKTKQ